MKGAPLLEKLFDLITCRATAIALWLLCIALLLLDAWGLTIFRGHFDYAAAGTWGSWVSSAASLVAVTVALWGNQMTHARYLADKAEREDRELTEVSAWTEYSVDEAGQTCLDLVIRNKTGHPIHRWSVNVSSLGTMDSHALGPLTPDDNRFSLTIPKIQTAFASLPCQITFTDRVGRLWATCPSGGKALIQSSKGDG